MIDKSYKTWLTDLKGKIRSAQIKAAVSVNTELITLYWDMGKMITEKQTAWGTGFLEQLSKDLKTEFPDMEGFSRTNLFSMRQFYIFYNKALSENPSLPFVHQPGGQIANTQLIHQAGGQLQADSILFRIPWRHLVLIINKKNSFEEAFFYVKRPLKNIKK